MNGKNGVWWSSNKNLFHCKMLWHLNKASAVIFRSHAVCKRVTERLRMVCLGIVGFCVRVTKNSHRTFYVIDADKKTHEKWIINQQLDALDFRLFKLNTARKSSTPAVEKNVWIWDPACKLIDNFYYPKTVIYMKNKRLTRTPTKQSSSLFLYS